MTETMQPEDVPDELKAILDQTAGKEHSATGPVMTCLAEILAKHKQQVRAQAADEIEAELVTLTDDSMFTQGTIHTIRRIARRLRGQLCLRCDSGSRVACTCPTRAPQGTGDAHNPGREHGEGSGGCEASQERSGLGTGKGD